VRHLGRNRLRCSWVLKADRLNGNVRRENESTYTNHVQDLPELSIDVSVQKSCVGSYVPKQVLETEFCHDEFFYQSARKQRTLHPAVRILHTNESNLFQAVYDLSNKHTFSVICCVPEFTPRIQGVTESPSIRACIHPVFHLQCIAECPESRVRSSRR
jgi:hypothetical protein